MNIKYIESLCDRINFSLLYEDYDLCEGEQILYLTELLKTKLKVQRKD